MNNLYEILGVDKESTLEEIKKAYKILANKYHPDKGGDSSLFVNVQKAYDVLSDPEARKIYDETGNISKIDNSRAEDISVLAQFISTAVTHINSSNFGYSDIFKVIDGLISATVAQTKQSMSAVDERLLVEKMVLDKIKKKDSIVYSVIAKNVEALNKNIEAHKERLKILDRVKDLFEEARDDPDSTTISAFIGTATESTVTQHYY